MSLTLARALFVLGLLILSPFVPAQCGTQWLHGAGDGFPREGEVLASTMWDPDGAGPATERLVVVGDMITAGHLASWDSVTGDWAPVAANVNGKIRAVTALPNGDLVIAGDFTQPVPNIARWDGTSWSAMGTGMTPTWTSDVRALCTLPNGDVVAGGWFSTAGGVSANQIARWDGTAWSAMGSGMDSWVMSLAAMPNGDVIAGGQFTMAGGVAANGLARWDGSTWSTPGGGNPGGALGLLPLANGDLATADGGSSTATSGSAWRFDGAAWAMLGTGMNGSVRALTELPNGDLVAAGSFTTAGGIAAQHVARWDGTAWSAVGAGVGFDVNTLATLPNGEFVAAGATNLTAQARIARWDGSAWHEMGTGVGDGTISTTPTVDALTTLPNGNLVATGSFYFVGNLQANSIAQWDGNAWSPLGQGLPSPTRWGLAVVAMPNGDVVAGGQFGYSGPGAVNNIARWDGLSWSALGAGMSSSSGTTGGVVRAMTVMPNGDLVAAGDFTFAGGQPANYVARWDGTTWSPLGSGLNASVHALAALPNGDLVAGGNFSLAGGIAAARVARWDGSSWSALGAGVPAGVLSLHVRPNGDLVAGRAGHPGIAIWDGTSWSTPGGGIIGSVYAMTSLPNGDLVAGGYFGTAGSVGARNIARWDGAAWSALGPEINGGIFDLTILPNGEVVAGGFFTTVGGRFSVALARVATTCPATATPAPTACLGSAGPLTVVADTLPWVGGTFHTTTTGFAAGALSIAVVGFNAPNVLLSSLHPSGLPGCYLQASLDSQGLLLPTNGTATSQFSVPNDTSYVGMTLHVQTLQLELSPTLALSSSNGLQLLIGAF